MEQKTETGAEHLLRFLFLSRVIGVNDAQRY